MGSNLGRVIVPMALAAAAVSIGAPATAAAALTGPPAPLRFPVFGMSRDSSSRQTSR